MKIEKSIPKMKGLVMNNYGSASELQATRLPIPDIAEDEVLIQVKSAGINHIDILKASGIIRHIYPLEFPWIPGVDFAGVVIAVGRLISRFKVGDEVYGSKAEGGAYAEFISVNQDLIAKKPASLSFTAAAGVPMAAETAYQALFNYGKLQAGETILIHGGAGAVGSCAVQLAHNSGITVIVSASGTYEQYLKNLGASEVVDTNYGQTKLEVKDVDMVLDLIGGRFQDQLFPVLRRGGYLVATNQLPSSALAEKYGVNTVFMHARPQSKTLQQFAEMIDSGKLNVKIANEYSLFNATDAWENLGLNYAKANPAKTSRRNGKHVLLVGEQ